MITGVKKATLVSPEYRTQKAVGLKALQENHFHTPPFDVYGIEHFSYESVYDTPVMTEKLAGMKKKLKELQAYQKELGTISTYHKQYLDSAVSYLINDIEKEEGKFLNPPKQLGLFQARANLERFLNKFVRPCPMVPRHGFVDSRPVRTIEEAENLLEETLKAEDKAEFIVMPFIKAEYSGIWTNGKLVIGKGNDGATAGHSSRMIPALGIPSVDKWSWKSALQRGRITETPYVELLWSKEYNYSDELNTLFVQLRNGPSLPDTTDYIPEEITVEKIVLAEGDLLEWETKAKEFTRGTVVYHPEGSLASHYAVHAVLAKIPVMISRKPEIGEVLKVNTESYTPDLELIRAGFVLGCQETVDQTTAAYAMLVGCHSTAVWLGRQDILLGFALGCCYRLTITAALGEYRHEPGRKRKPGRNTVYNNVWKKILQPSTRTRYLKALESFNTDTRWPSSFGGKKWYVFGSYAGLIYNSVLDGDIKKALENLNKCVNAVHNSGWGFDKFLSRDVMDQTAKSPSVTLLKCAPVLYEIMVKENERIRADYFKGKHPVEIDELDIEAAKADEKKEEKDGRCDNHIYQEEKFKNPKSLLKVQPGGTYNLCSCCCSGEQKDDCGSLYDGTKIESFDSKVHVYLPCKLHEFAYASYKKLTAEEAKEYGYDSTYDPLVVKSEYQLMDGGHCVNKNAECTELKGKIFYFHGQDYNSKTYTYDKTRVYFTACEKHIKSMNYESSPTYTLIDPEKWAGESLQETVKETEKKMAGKIEAQVQVDADKTSDPKFEITVKDGVQSYSKGSIKFPKKYLRVIQGIIDANPKIPGFIYHPSECTKLILHDGYGESGHYWLRHLGDWAGLPYVEFNKELDKILVIYDGKSWAYGENLWK